MNLKAAADHLAVTPELLVSFTRRPVFGDDPAWRLSAEQREGRLWFSAAELDRFSARLREPWCEADELRPPIPSAISRFLSVECLGECPMCHKAAPREIAHITPFHLSRSHHPHGLIRLCAACHRSFDDGLVPIETLQALKAELQARLRQMLRTEQALEGFAPPPLAAGFSGRETELSALAVALRETTSLLIFGIGGSGKTQLLLQALRASDFGRPIYWVSVEQYPTTDVLRAALRGLATALGARPDVDVMAPLNAQRACLVLDGVERLGGDFDGLNDLIGELLGASIAAQVVATSQVSLASLPFETSVRLQGLPATTAQQILVHGMPQVDDKDALSSLVAFADGHALTLRIVAALMRHFGGAAPVLTRVEQQGALAVVMPARRAQTRLTSLELCLELAMGQLNDDERRLLWAVAEAPAGLFPNVLPPASIGLSDEDAARAGLRAWDLVQAEGPADHLTLRMLSPVRSFCQAWHRKHPPPDAEKMEQGFSMALAMRAMVLDQGLIHGGRAPLGMALMERELPNFAAAFALSVGSTNADTRRAASLFADALMTFLFTTGRFRFGFDLMMRAVEVEREVGDIVDALETLLQAQSLAIRADQREAADRVLRTAQGWPADEPKAQALIWSIEASHRSWRGDYEDAAKLAAEAYEILAQDDPDGQQAQGILGVRVRALEYSGRPADALPLYEAILAGVEARQDPINRGSILHHLGNCLAHTGQPVEAFQAYIDAAQQFADIDAVEFLSNAFGEAGILLPDLPASFDLAEHLPENLVRHAVEDAVSELFAHVPATDDFALKPAIVRLRKAGGAMWLASLSSVREDLAGLAETLVQTLSPHLPPETQRGPLSEHDIFLFQVTWFLNLMHVVGSPETHAPASLREVQALAHASHSAFLGPLRESLRPVLSAYLSRRRDVHMTPDELEALAEAYETSTGWSSPEPSA